MPNSVRRLVWAGLAVWALGLAAYHAYPHRAAVPSPGAQVLFAGDRGPAADGAAVAVLPRDSMVAVLYLSARCGACRVGVPAYAELAPRVRASGVAFRAVVLEEGDVFRQYAALFPPGESRDVIADTQRRLERRLGVRSVPTLLLVGRDGRLVRRWAPLPADAPGAIASAVRPPAAAGE